MFLAEQRSIPLDVTKNLEIKKSNYNEYNENQENFDDNYDTDLIILHRSLYILKKKFEKYKDEFKDIYIKYREILSGDDILQDEILVEQNQIPKILDEILNFGKFGLIECDNFKEAVFEEMKLYDKIKLDNKVISALMDFVFENRRKYNYIFKEKKLNKNFQLELYMDYMPQGNDELTRIVIETEGGENNKKNKDNISEVVTTMNKLDDNESINFNGEILEKNEGGGLGIEEKEKNEENEQEENTRKKKLKPKTILLRKSPTLLSDKQDNKKVQYSKSYLYIESLLLILADFISDKKAKKSYIITDHSDEYRNELRTLFDNEILGRLGEEVQYEVNRNKVEQLKDLLINKTKIEKNINCYEEILNKMRTMNQNVDFVLITINKLKKTLNWVDQKISILQNDTNTFNEFENAIQVKQLNKEIKRFKNKNNRNLNININIDANNTKNNLETTNNNKMTMESTKNGKDYKKFINENNFENNMDELSDISILKLDNKIEGLDTERLVDLNIIDASNAEENSVFLQKDKKKILKPRTILPKIKTKNLTKEEKREINLKEIFNFYSHLHTNAGHKLTFDSIKDKFEHLNLNEFLKFCNEFKILLPKEILSKIFLKKSELTKEMSFLEFQVTLNEISVEINQEKIKQLKKRVKMYRNNGETELIKKCNDEINLLKQKTREELIEEFYEYLEIDDVEKYRKKMKGFDLPIFYNNIYNNDLNNKIKITENKKTPIKLDATRQIYIKEIINQRKEQKKILEKKLLRLTGLDREHQKKKLDINNKILLLSNKNKLEPIDKRKLDRGYNKSMNYKNKNNKIINMYEKNFDLDNNKNNDRYDYNKEREEEARRDILKKLNLKINNNENNNMHDISELMIQNKNEKNKKDNKYNWDMLNNMKSYSLIDERELNNLIN